MGKHLKPTNASQWRKKTEMVEMPSGNIAELQRINLVALIGKHDNVPNFLLLKVNEMLNGSQKTKLLKAKEVDETIAAKDAIQAVLWMSKAVFVYPRLVDGEPQSDDEVRIDDLSLEDLMFATTYAIGDLKLVDAADRFRETENGNVESLPTGDGVVSETE